MSGVDAGNRQLRDQFWHLLCHRTELPVPGDFVKLRWLGEEVVLFNDGGEIVVFDNLCPHRGTRFFTDAYGNGAVSCKYHGWAYRNGAMHIPCRERYTADDLANAHLNELKTEWCADFLFVSVAPLRPLEVQLGDAYDQLASISFNINGRTDLDQYTFECDWRVAMENALEPVHVSFVHPESLGRLELADGDNQFGPWHSVWYAPVQNAAMRRKLASIKGLFQIDEQYEGYMSIYLFPFTMLSSTFGYSYSLQNFFPSDAPNQTMFTSRLLRSATKNQAAAGALQGFFQSSAEMNRQVFREDHEICRRIDPGFIDNGKPPILSADEEKIRHFRTCLGAAGFGSAEPA